MNVAQELFQRAAAQPGMPAILAGARRLTYADFAAAVLRAEAGLLAQGVVPGGVVVAGTMRDAAMQLCLAFALARLGAVQLPLSATDPPARLAEICALAEARAVIADAALPLPAAVRRLAADPGWLDPAASPAPPREMFRGGDAPWLLNHSSGTTGRPKAMLITHAMELARATRQSDPALACRPGERFLVLLSAEFWVGRAWSMRCLGEGGTLVLGAPMTGELGAFIAAAGIHHLRCAPVHLEGILRTLPADCPAPAWPSMRTLRAATARLTASLLAEARQRLTPNIFVSYGANETGNITFAGPDDLAAAPRAVGRPCGEAEIALVDEAGRPVPPGMPGQVRLRTPGMVAGYVGDAGATARLFRDGWFLPGDLARMDAAGRVTLLGRSDEMMNYDGMLVSPAEIEEVLLGHPAVVEAACFPLPVSAHRERPAAAVVLRPPADLTAVIAYAEERLGRRAPVRLMRVATLPRNAIGKVLKRELAERMARALAL